MSLLNKNNKELSRNKISTFNSKLFLPIELSEENIISNSNTEDSEISIKSPCLKLKDYLSNDLIEELELPSDTLNTNTNNKIFFNEEEKEKKNNSPSQYTEIQENIKDETENNIWNNNLQNNYNLKLNNYINNYAVKHNNPLIPLLNKGYEFIPKNLKSNNFKAWPKFNNEDENTKISNFIKNNIHLFKKNKKEDWYCSFCNNLNYSFRIKCNRCGTSKESSDYAYKKMFEQQNYVYNQNNNNYTISSFNKNRKSNF